MRIFRLCNVSIQCAGADHDLIRQRKKNLMAFQQAASRKSITHPSRVIDRGVMAYNFSARSRSKPRLIWPSRGGSSSRDDNHTLLSMRRPGPWGILSFPSAGLKVTDV